MGKLRPEAEATLEVAQDTLQTSFLLVWWEKTGAGVRDWARLWAARTMEGEILAGTDVQAECLEGEGLREEKDK